MSQQECVFHHASPFMKNDDSSSPESQSPESILYKTLGDIVSHELLGCTGTTTAKLMALQLRRRHPGFIREPDINHKGKEKLIPCCYNCCGPLNPTWCCLERRPKLTRTQRRRKYRRRARLEVAGRKQPKAAAKTTALSLAGKYVTTHFQNRKGKVHACRLYRHQVRYLPPTRARVSCPCGAKARLPSNFVDRPRSSFKDVVSASSKTKTVDREFLLQKSFVGLPPSESSVKKKQKRQSSSLSGNRNKGTTHLMDFLSSLNN